MVGVLPTFRTFRMFAVGDGIASQSCCCIVGGLDHRPFDHEYTSTPWSTRLCLVTAVKILVLMLCPKGHSFANKPRYRPTCGPSLPPIDLPICVVLSHSMERIEVSNPDPPQINSAE